MAYFLPLGSGCLTALPIGQQEIFPLSKKSFGEACDSLKPHASLL